MHLVTVYLPCWIKTTTLRCMSMLVADEACTVKLVIQAGSQIEAGSPIQAGSRLGATW